MTGITVMVTGGRDYTDEAHVYRVLDRIHASDPIRLVMHGACGWNADDRETWTADRMLGADALADTWADARGVRVGRYPAHWTTQGRGAGPRRNAKLVAMMPDRCVVFPGGPGTAGACALATKAGIVMVREDEPANVTGAETP